MNPNTRIIDLTVAQLAEVIDRAVAESLEKRQTSDGMPRYVYGIKGIEDLFHVSNRKAREMKDGVLRKAVRQEGRTIVTDVDLAFRLFGKSHS